MLSVIIPTEGVEQPAVATLAALVPGAAAGVMQARCCWSTAPAPA